MGEIKKTERWRPLPRTCGGCDKKISGYGRTGLCHSCAIKAYVERKKAGNIGTICRVCRWRQITTYTQLGICNHCYLRLWYQKKLKTCIACGARVSYRTASNLCLKCRHGEWLRHETQVVADHRSLSLEQQRGRLSGDVRMGVCHMPDCGRRFRLESWQHPKIHYCPKCRQREEYKNYNSTYGISKRRHDHDNIHGHVAR